MCPQDATVGRSGVIRRPSLVSPSAKDRNCSALLRQLLAIMMVMLLGGPCQYPGGVNLRSRGLYCSLVGGSQRCCRTGSGALGSSQDQGFPRSRNNAFPVRSHSVHLEMMEKHLASVCAWWTGVTAQDGLGPHGSLLTSMPLRACILHTLSLNLL